jgi:hypothetical protein
MFTAFPLRFGSHLLSMLMMAETKGQTFIKKETDN